MYDAFIAEQEACLKILGQIMADETDPKLNNLAEFWYKTAESSLNEMKLIAPRLNNLKLTSENLECTLLGVTAKALILNLTTIRFSADLLFPDYQIAH